MSVETILIPKLEVDFFNFNPVRGEPLKTTVKQLKGICKSNGLTQVGLKAELIKKLQENDLLPKLEGEHPAGPRWFYFDEAFGAGEHTLHYMCMCGAAMSLDIRNGFDRRRFYISESGAVGPSIYCGNDNCRWHIWGKLEDYDGGRKRYGKNSVYEYKNYRYYNPKRDNKNSKLYNKKRRNWY